MNTAYTPRNEERCLRKLGGLERYHLMLQDFLHTNVVVHALVSGKITEDSLRHALDSLQRRHPLMRARIDRRRTGARFMTGSVPRIPLRIIDIPDTSWHTVAEEELNTPLPVSRGPLLRCTLARHSNRRATILLTYSHTIGDGLAGACMMQDLLRFAAGDIPHDEAPLELRNAMEHYFPRERRGLNGFLSWMRINNDYMKKIRSAGGSFMPAYDGEASLRKRHIQIVPRRIDIATVQKLSRRARDEGTTVNSALTAAHLMALARDMDRPGPVPMALMSAVNLRNSLTIKAGREINNFAGSCNTLHRVNPNGGIWELAREHRCGLLAGIEKGEPMLHLLGLNLYDGIIRWIGHDNFAARAVDNFYARFSQKMTIVSNMGILDMTTKRGALTVENLGFASSSRASGMIYSIIATAGQWLTWNFVGTHPLYTREHLERIADQALVITMDSLDR